MSIIDKQNITKSSRKLCHQYALNILLSALKQVIYHLWHSFNTFWASLTNWKYCMYSLLRAYWTEMISSCLSNIGRETLWFDIYYGFGFYICLSSSEFQVFRSSGLFFKYFMLFCVSKRKMVHLSVLLLTIIFDRN